MPLLAFGFVSLFLKDPKYCGWGFELYLVLRVMRITGAVSVHFGVCLLAWAKCAGFGKKGNLHAQHPGQYFCAEVV